MKQIYITSPLKEMKKCIVDNPQSVLDTLVYIGY